MRTSQNQPASGIGSLFPNQIQVYNVCNIDEKPPTKPLLHQHFNALLVLEDWLQLCKEIANFLWQQEPDAVYSFFNRHTYNDNNNSNAEWYLHTARLKKTDADTPKEIVVFTYNLQLLGDSRKMLYRVLENDIFFKAHFLKVSQLTKREKAVLGLLYLGLSSNQIAEKLYISTHTVNTHRKRIHQKLQTDSVAILLQYIEVFDLAPEKLLYNE